MAAARLPLALQLLRHAAGTPCKRLAGGDDPVQLEWVLDGGLAPLLHAAIREGWMTLPSAWREQVLAGELSALMRREAIQRTTGEVIDACLQRGAEVTLLKGISLSESCYPMAHWRPMGDVDVLIAADRCEAVEADLLRRGYRPLQTYRPEPGACHGTPLFDARHGVWVEVHRTLFPAHSPLLSGSVFDPAQFAARSVRADFLGRPVLRLAPELELAYVASAWVRDLTRAKSHPAFLPPMFDAVFLLKAYGRALDWARLDAWLDNELAAASVYVLLGYLVRRGCCQLPEDVLPALLASQDLVDRVEVALLHHAIDRHLIGGQPERLFQAWHLWENLMKPGRWPAKMLGLPWNILFPPSRRGRYDSEGRRVRVARVIRGRTA